MNKYTQWVDKMDQISDELNEAETLYFAQVTLRVDQELLKALQ